MDGQLVSPPAARSHGPCFTIQQPEWLTGAAPQPLGKAEQPESGHGPGLPLPLLHPTRGYSEPRA